MSKNFADKGTITSSGKEMNVDGLGEYRGVKNVTPFGIISTPPVGSEVQVLRNWGTGSNATVVGAIQNKDIENGELLLYSEGGAEILLKNNGDIVFNGGFTVYADGSTNISFPRKGAD